ncbi:MAG: TolC family protein [Fimbriimonas sp.]
MRFAASFRRPSILLLAIALVGAVLVPQASAQETLTLEDALKLARDRNGSLRAAYLNVLAAESRVRQSGAVFLPTVTPSASYRSNRTEVSKGAFVQSEGASTRVDANWLILDSGSRLDSLRASKASAEAQRFSTSVTLRNTLYSVHTQFYDTLRAQELYRVTQSQVARAEKILDQVKTGIQLRSVAAKDELQAQADLLNAKVSALTSLNRTAATQATLKGTLGLDQEKDLPKLVAPDLASDEPADMRSINVEADRQSLKAITEKAIRTRPDLRAQRFSINSQEFSVGRLKKRAGLSYTVEAGFNQTLTPDALEARALTFSLSYPLFDGNASREAVRESQYNLAGAREELIQAERTARAEIESTYKEYLQNGDRLVAAKAALAAARKNYEAAVESQTSGAADLIDVLTAQVSLVTAESNYIEAVYDYKISSVKLKLVTGEALPGQ